MGKKLLKNLQDEYLPTNMVPDENLINQIKAVVGYRREKGPEITNYSDLKNIIDGLLNSIIRQEKQNTPILPIYGQLAKNIISIMGFPYFQADGEAEALCASLNVEGLVDAVLTEDTDVLAYGSPYLLSRIDLSNEKVSLISHQDILTTLNFTTERFRDLCILLGCDYNDRVQGFPPDGKKRKKPVSIGAKGAIAMMLEYQNLEEAEKHIVDADPLNYRRCRELFTPVPIPEMTIPYNKPIDKDKLSVFLKENRVRMNMQYILDTWQPVHMVFKEEDEEIVNDW